MTPTNAGQTLYRRAKELIPGGTQLLSKNPDRFLPGHWPAYYSKAKGETVWDLVGNKYTDMSYHGIGACVLGYADKQVDDAVVKSVRAGVASTLNCPEEVELAEDLVRLHKWAGGVRFTRAGGEAMAMAVRIARAHTRRDVIVFCGYHGWHDWYLAANLADDKALDGHLLPGLSPAGVPRGLKGTAVPFHYGKLDELDAALAANAGRVAAVVMEPLRNRDPPAGFLEGVRQRAHKAGALLVFDEVTSGFRICAGGAHRKLGVNPDIAVFAKAMGNGYAIAAVLGTAAAMSSAQDSFISSTNWTERIGPTAGLATLRKFQATKADRRLVALGTRVQKGWTRAAKAAGLSVHVSGIEPLGHFGIDGPQAEAAHTLFSSRMLERGFLATNSFYASCGHTDAAVARYLEACDEVFVELAQHQERKTLNKALRSGVRRSGFARLT